MSYNLEISQSSESGTMGVFGNRARRGEASSQHSHWTKDFVEHLRTVHFALVLVAVVLIVTSTNTEYSRLKTALTQIQQIAKLEQKWPSVPYQLYGMAMVDANFDMSWTTSVRIELPKDIYADGPIDTFLDVSENEMAAAKPWNLGEISWPSKLTTLTDFKHFWNVLDGGIDVILIKPPGKQFSCRQLIRFTKPKPATKATDDVAAGTTERSLTITEPGINCTFHELPPISALEGFKFDFNHGFISTIETNDAVQKTQTTQRPRSIWLEATSEPLPPSSRYGKNKTEMRSVTLILLDYKTVRIKQDDLNRIMFYGWSRGTFDKSFRELSSVTNDLSELEIGTAISRLESQAASAEKSISLIGFNVPTAQLALWGPLVLLAIQFYLWLHLHELSSRIEPSAEGLNVAWVGVYRTRWAGWIGVISCFFLPVFAAYALAYRSNTVGFYYPHAVLAISWSVILLSAIIGSLTVSRLKKLRKNLLENVPPEEPVDAV